MDNRNNSVWDGDRKEHERPKSGDRIRKRSRSQKIFNPGTVNSDDDDEDIGRIYRRSPIPIVQPDREPPRAHSGRGKSLAAMKRRHERSHDHESLESSYEAEAHRIFPGYASGYDDRHEETRRRQVSSFTNKPAVSLGDFPSVASKALRPPIRNEGPPSDDDYDGYGYTYGDPKRCRYVDSEGYRHDRAPRNDGFMSCDGFKPDTRGRFDPGDQTNHVGAHDLGLNRRDRSDSHISGLNRRRRLESYDQDHFDLAERGYTGSGKLTQMDPDGLQDTNSSLRDRFASAEGLRDSGQTRRERGSSRESESSWRQRFDPDEHHGGGLSSLECYDPGGRDKRDHNRGPAYKVGTRQYEDNSAFNGVSSRINGKNWDSREEAEVSFRADVRHDTGAKDDDGRWAYEGDRVAADQHFVDAARIYRKQVEAKAETSLRRRPSDEKGKPRVPETVSIISNDSRGSEKVSPVVENAARTSQSKRQKRAPLEMNPVYESPPDSAKQPILEVGERDIIRIDRDHIVNKVDRPTKRHALQKEPEYPIFDFGVGDPDSRVDNHIMVMTLDAHENNPVVTNLMMEDYAYTAYPFGRRDMLEFAYSGDLAPVAKAVSQMFQKVQKDKNVRVEFIDHQEFAEGKSLTLVVGTLDKELSKKEQPKEEIGSVVTVVAGAFKGGKGIVKAIRDKMVLLLMSADGSSVRRWLSRSLIEVMDEAKLLQQIEGRGRQSHQETESLMRRNRSPQNLMTAIQNSFIDGGPPRSPSRIDELSNKECMPEPSGGSKTSDGDFLEDLSTSFDPELYSMMDHEKLGTPRPYDDGTSFLSPLLREARDIEYADEIANRPPIPIPAAAAVAALNPTDKSEEPKVSTKDNEASEVTCAVPNPDPKPASPEPEPLLPPTVEIDDDLSSRKTEESGSTSETKASSAKRSVRSRTNRGAAAVEGGETKQAPTGAKVKDVSSNSQNGTARKAATRVEAERRPPLKKRKSVPAIDLRDREKSQASRTEAILPEPPHEENPEIPTETHAKVYVNQTAENGDSSTTKVAAPIAESKAGKTAGSVPASKSKGRPKKGQVRDTSSAKSFIESLSLLELKDKLRRLGVPSSGNRTNLIKMLSSALMVDEETPIEALPDMITRFNA